MPESKFKKLLNKVGEKIKGQDSYGQKVELTIGGEDSYKSILGGVLTILLSLGLLIYGILELNKTMIKPYEWDIKAYEFRQKISQAKPIKIDRAKFLEGVGIVSKTRQDLNMDRSYGHFIFRNRYSDDEILNEFGMESLFIPTTNCYANEQSGDPTAKARNDAWKTNINQEFSRFNEGLPGVIPETGETTLTVEQETDIKMMRLLPGATCSYMGLSDAALREYCAARWQIYDKAGATETFQECYENSGGDEALDWLHGGLTLYADPQGAQNYLEYSYIPCAQKEETYLGSTDHLGQPIVCKSEADVAKMFEKGWEYKTEALGLLCDPSTFSDPDGDECVQKLTERTINFFWYEKYIGARASAETVNAVNRHQNNGTDAYDLFPRQQSITEHISNTDEEKIVTLKYYQNKFIKSVRTPWDNEKGETESEEEYATLKYGYSDSVKRSASKKEVQPFFTYRIEIDLNSQITTSAQQGDSWLDVILAVIGLIGGLFASFSGFVVVFVTYMMKGSFAAYMTKNLFLAQKYNEKNALSAEGKKNQVSDAALEDARKISPWNQKAYERLKKNLDKGAIDNVDVECILNEMKYNRYPMSSLMEDKAFVEGYVYGPVAFLFCCKKKSDKQTRFQYEVKRSQEVQRKFDKYCDLLHLLQSIKKSDLIANSIFTGPQHLLAMMQRSGVVEQQDVTDSDDQLADLYDSHGEVQAGLADKLRQFTKEPPSQLNKILLKGFYTNDRTELGNPRLLGKDANPEEVQPKQEADSETKMNARPDKKASDQDNVTPALEDFNVKQKLKQDKKSDSLADLVMQSQEKKDGDDWDVGDTARDLFAQQA